MLETILQYVVQYLPAVVAIVGELAIVKSCFTTLSKAKATEEFKAVAAQNKVLVQELRESKRLNKELLTKIDKIQRGEE